ncbi:MAG: hypothetical protein A2031_10260 [Deltaproteobacteria bacterium RBG_19FT_COMBO_43_11]|nr:MAG: hypothetical protein A2031_10260 [Deltaproteobacteria bacterium RBG_19FT_COMBO_43_11]
MNKIFQIFMAIVLFWGALAYGEINTKGHKCLLPAQDFMEVDNCIFSSKTGQLFIAPTYIKELSFEKHGLAVLYSSEEGWMYVNRKGRVVISGVAAMDNGADVFHDGLVRFTKDNKWGFADVTGKIVVPAIYDCAFNFENGLAKVSHGCELKCVDEGCEYFYFSGGEWFYINTRGKIVKKDIFKEDSHEQRRTD